MSTPKLEGWLIKKRGDYHKNKFLGKDNMRWFKLQEVTGTDHAELALCYFKSQKEKEPKGWIFAKDINEIRDTHNTFTVISPGRTMTIECQTPHEQFLWLKNLLEHCHNADTSRIFSISTEFLKERKSKKNVHKNEYKEESKSSFDRSSSLFSRNAVEANEIVHFTDAIKGSGNSVNIVNEENENIPNSNQQNTNTDEDYTDSLVSIDANEIINNSKSNQNFKNSIGRTSTNQREDFRNSRNSGNLGVTTSNRLSKHISRDTSPSTIIQKNSNRTTNNQEFDQQEKSGFIPSKYIHEDHLNNSTTIALISAIVISDSSNSGKDVEDITLETDEVMKHRAKLRDRRNRNSHHSQRRMDGRSHYYNNDDDYCSHSNSSSSEITSLSRHRDIDSKHESDSVSRTTTASATTTHVPRRVKDILDDESRSASSSVNNKHRLRIDDLLLKRENFTTSTAADSKLDDSRSDEEVDFKAEMKKYNEQLQQQDSKETNPSTVRTCNCNNIYRTCECTANTSRPPRCPPSGAPPYNLCLANNSNNNHSNNMIGSNTGKENALSKFRVAGTTRSYTPPRKSADPGSKVDENFVNDNWDEDDINADHRHTTSDGVGDKLKAQNKYTTDKITDQYSREVNIHNNNNGHIVGVKKKQPSATTIMSSNIRNTVTYVGKTVEADRNWLQEDFDEN